MNHAVEFLQSSRVAIFLVHGVVRQHRHGIRNAVRKHVTLDRFASVLRQLCAEGLPVSIPQIVAASHGRVILAERAFAITFDDGFENNYSVAAPVLHALKIPATFYITTGLIDTNGASWTDLIEYAIGRTPTVRLRAPLTAFEGTYATPEQKLGLLDRIRRLVKPDPRIDPYEFAGEIWRQLGVTSMDPDPELDQKLSWSQIQELSRDPLFTIGGHGHTHRILEHLDEEALEREVALNVQRLRTQLRSPVEHFSYPEGLAHCYSPRVIAALRRHSLVSAVTAEEGTNRIGEDLFCLKRIALTEVG